MSISIEKLTKYIDKCNFYINTYYSIKGHCVYIDVVSKANGNNYLLYIPSKYRIRSSNVKSFELKQISDIVNTKDVTLEYGSDKNHKFDEMYNMVDMNKEDMDEAMLSNNYKRNLKIEDVKSRSNEEVKSIYRQMNRFKYAVENLRYKLSILYNSYICVLNRNNDIIYYYIKNRNKSDNKKSLIVCFDLEMLYDKNYIIHNELSDVKTNIEQLLLKNYNLNLNITSRMVQKNIDLDAIKSMVEQKKNRLEIDYNELKTTLSTIVVKENMIRDNIKNEGQTPEYSVRLKDILREKGARIIEMINMISKRDDLILRCDSILFDNIIMFDKISKNMKLLREL
jgi:hypothetical protein